MLYFSPGCPLGRATKSPQLIGATPRLDPHAQPQRLAAQPRTHVTNRNYYYTNALVVNAGSTTADTVGLYHFTTQTNQSIESTSRVDIGYHYVATDANGNPSDSNADGTPDYISDANGNGDVDSGEIGWNVMGDLGLNVIITRPDAKSNIP